MDYTSEPDAAYIAGKIAGIILFPILIYGIGYLIIRVTSKRKPNPKEKRILIIVGIVLFIVGVVGQAAKNVAENS